MQETLAVAEFRRAAPRRNGIDDIHPAIDYRLFVDYESRESRFTIRNYRRTNRWRLPKETFRR